MPPSAFHPCPTDHISHLSKKLPSAAYPCRMLTFLCIIGALALGLVAGAAWMLYALANVPPRFPW